MMAVTGFLRVLKSSGLLLLLVAMSTTTLVQPVGAATSGTSSNECLTEAVACNADATCLSCDLYTLSGSAEEVDECHKFDAQTTSSEGCDFRMEVACCLDELSEFDCLENDEYVDWYGCYLASLGCSDEITCNGAAHANLLGGGASTVIAFSCAFMVMLQLLVWV